MSEQSSNTLFYDNRINTGVRTTATTALTTSVICWLVIVLIGQWLFALYIGIRYGIPVASGDYNAVNQGLKIDGYQAGAGLDNLIYFGHILPAILLSVGGVLQFVPQIRRKLPWLHRWNGRMFLTLGLLGALTGLYLTWVRGSRLSDLGALGITLNGLLIPLAVYMAWRFARAGNFKAHQRWAIHSFLLINGVWAFRLFLFGWLVLNQGPKGNTALGTGPADLFFSVACYLLPMLVAELVFWAQRQPGERIKWGVSLIMGLGSILTLFGIFAVSMAGWLPAIIA